MRRELLDQAGWRTIVLTSQDYYRHRDHTVGRIEATLVERGVLGSSGGKQVQVREQACPSSPRSMLVPCRLSGPTTL